MNFAREACYALCGGRRFRPAGNRIPDLPLLADRCAGGRWAGARRRASCSWMRWRYRNATACCRKTSTRRPARLWGNFPQTYSMAGLILTAMRLSRSWEDRYWRGLIIVSNRVAVPSAMHQPGRRAGSACSLLKRHPGVWFGWSGKFRTTRTRDQDRSHMAPIAISSPTSPRPTIRNITTASPTGCCGRSCTTGWIWRNSPAATFSGYLRVNAHFADQLIKISAARRHHLGA